MKGSVFGGQQPISAAKVYLLAAGSGSYGAAVTSVLGAASNTAADNSSLPGTTLYFTTTDSSGSFSITGDYTCTAGQQVFLYAAGGDAGGGPNSAIGLMAALGACPSAGNFLVTNPAINIDEVTTVATAYALAGYAIDPLHIGAPTSRTATFGLPNAMANVANIVDLSSGTALIAPANAPAGTVPADKINALADILAACINGAANNASCGTLFTSITSNGNPSTGTSPTDTATAAIDMAKNQWNAPPAIFGLINATSPFPTMTASATDLSLPITYPFADATGGAGLQPDSTGAIWASCNSCSAITRYSPQGASTSSSTSGSPQNFAIDYAGNVWVTQPNAGTLAVYNSSGTAVPGSPYNPTISSAPALANPTGLSFDSGGNAYVANASNGSVVELTSSGTYRATVSTTTPNAVATAVANNGDLWVGSNNSTAPLYYFPKAASSSQTLVSLAGCGSSPQLGTGLAVDPSNNAWFSCSTGVARITPTGTVTPYFTATHGGGTLAIDSTGNVFEAGGSTGAALNEFSSSGAMLSTASGYSLPSANNQFIAIDVSGNVWVTGTSAIYQELGMAAPTAAPGATNVWARPIHMVYALTGGPALSESDSQVLAALAEVPGGATALTPFLLNIKNPSKYATMISAVQAMGSVIIPGVGQSATGNTLYNSANQTIAAAYKQYTDYIRLENTQGFYDNTNGQADIHNMIDYCVSLGFKHIMLNPWPMSSVGVPVPFTNPEVDADFEQVTLDYDHQTYVIIPDPTNFYPGNQNNIDGLRAYRPSMNFVINYESAPQQQVLTDLEQANPGSSIPYMNITATQIELGPPGVYWAVPMTSTYDPILLGTWSWEATRLGDFQ